MNSFSGRWICILRIFVGLCNAERRAQLLTLLASKWIKNIGLDGDKGVVTNFHLFWICGHVKSEAQNAVWNRLLDGYYSLWRKMIQKLFGFFFGVPADDNRFRLVQGSVSSCGDVCSQNLSRLSHGVALFSVPNFSQVVIRGKY